MQELCIQGLDKVIAKLEESPEIFKEARARALDSVGSQVLSKVQSRIGGIGKIRLLQEYRLGSGKGYVAVRPRQTPSW